MAPGIGEVLLARFCDHVIARNKSFRYAISQSHACGDEIANVLNFAITMADDQPSNLDLVTIHRFTAKGKVASIRAFWEFPM